MQLFDDLVDDEGEFCFLYYQCITDNLILREVGRDRWGGKEIEVGFYGLG